MPTTYVLAFVVFLVAYAVSRFLNENAMKQLSTEDQAKLIGGLSSLRMASIILAVVIGLVLVLSPMMGMDTQAIRWSYPIALFVLVIVIGWLTWRRMHKLELPRPYIRTVVIASILRYVGVGVLVWAVVAPEVP